MQSIQQQQRTLGHSFKSFHDAKEIVSIKRVVMVEIIFFKAPFYQLTTKSKSLCSTPENDETTTTPTNNNDTSFYVIFKCLQNRLFKGRLPYAAPYFQYDLRVVEKFDPKYNSHFYQILWVDSISSIRTVPLESTVNFILNEELCGKIDEERKKNLRNYIFKTYKTFFINPRHPRFLFMPKLFPNTPNNSSGSIDLFNISEKTCIQYCAYMDPDTKVLRNFFPNLNCIHNDHQLNLLKKQIMDDSRQWLLFFKSERKKIHVKFASYSLKLTLCSLPPGFTVDDSTTTTKQQRYFLTPEKCRSPMLDTIQFPSVKKTHDKIPPFVPDFYVRLIKFYLYLKSNRRQSKATCFFRNRLPKQYKRLIVDPIINCGNILIKNSFADEMYYQFFKDSKRENFVHGFLKKFLLENNNVMSFDETYSKDVRLNENQQKAFECSIRNKVTLITGLPGRGKTFLLKCIHDHFCKVWGEESVMTVSKVASMVDGLRRRGFKNVYTIKHVVCKIQCEYRKKQKELKSPSRMNVEEEKKTAKSPEEGKQQEEKKGFLDRDIKMLIIDELTNVDLKLLKELLKCFTLYGDDESNIPLRKIVMAFDPLQIKSISAGNVAEDFIQIFEHLNSRIVLTDELRSSSYTNSMITNDNHLVKRSPVSMDFINVSSSQFNDKLSCFSKYGCYWIPEESKYNNNEGIIRQLNILCDQISVLQKENNEYHGNIRFIVLNNALKDHINNLFNKTTFKNEFYKGKRFVISKNYKAYDVKPTKYRLKTTPMSHPDDQRDEKPRALHCSELFNGQILRVDFFMLYDFKEFKWIIDSRKDHHVYQSKSRTVQENLLKNQKQRMKMMAPSAVDQQNKNIVSTTPMNIPSHQKWVMITTCGKCVIIDNTHPRYLSLLHVDDASCITVDKAQGEEYENVVFVIPKSFKSSTDTFDRHHIHVAMTRAKKRLLILGDWDTMMKISQRNLSTQRLSLLGEKMIETITMMKTNHPTSIEDYKKRKRK